MAWRAMPRCNNMSLRRTKSKVRVKIAGGIFETLVHNCHEIGGRAFGHLPSLTALKALTFQVKQTQSFARGHP